MKYLQWLALGLAIAIFAGGCRNCKNDELPVLEVVFRDGGAAPQWVSSTFFDQQEFFNGLQVPFLLSSNRSRYTFGMPDGEVEVLELQYEQHASFEDNECGFFLTIGRVEVQPETSFTNVEIQQTRNGWRVTISN